MMMAMMVMTDDLQDAAAADNDADADHHDADHHIASTNDGADKANSSTEIYDFLQFEGGDFCN